MGPTQVLCQKCTLDKAVMIINLLYNIQEFQKYETSFGLQWDSKETC